MDTSGRGRISEQPPLALPASDPTRLVPVRQTVAVSRTRDPKRSLAHIPRPFGKHRGNARRRSHWARRLFWRLGDWPSRLAEGERPPTRPSGVVTGNVRQGDRRNQVRAVATGVGRRVQRSRQRSKSLADAASAPKGVGEKVAIARTRRTTVGVPYCWVATTLQRGHPAAVRAISRRGHCNQRTDPIGSPPSPPDGVSASFVIKSRTRPPVVAKRKSPSPGG